MIRNIKALSLALVAVFALSAVVAGSASAAFRSEAASTQVTRSANNASVFQYQSSGIKVECKLVEGTGSFTGTTSTEFVTAPEYSGCSTVLGPADVKFNGCTYRFTSAVGSTAITVHIECPAGKQIEVTVTDGSETSICTLDIRSQTPGGIITGSNVGSGTTRETKIASASTGIVAERTGSSLCGPLTSSTGTYSGEITGTGENPTTKAHVGIFMD
jgi:hypothetical protein